MIIGREQAAGHVPLKAKTYYLLFGSDHMGAQVRTMHLRKLLNKVKAPQRVLDAGCRGGEYCFYLARYYPSAQILGIDINILTLQNAENTRQRLREYGANIMFKKSDLTTYRTGTPFDLICCIDVLEHIIDDETALSNLRASLDERGYLLLHVPQRVELNKYNLPGFSAPNMSEGHVREYTEEDIVLKVKRAGFEIQELQYTFGWAGSLARELYYKLEDIRFPPLRAILKGILAPFLLSLAYMDTLTNNKTRHQGFFICARGIQVAQ